MLIYILLGIGFFYVIAQLASFLLAYKMIKDDAEN